MPIDPSHESRLFATAIDAILASGQIREMYLDEEIATDGVFVMLITLYKRRTELPGIPVGAALDSAGARTSTAIYMLNRLVDWGYVVRHRHGDEDLYRLADAAERTVESYLRACVGKWRDLGLRIDP